MKYKAILLIALGLGAQLSVASAAGGSACLQHLPQLAEDGGIYCPTSAQLSTTRKCLQADSEQNPRNEITGAEVVTAVSKLVAKRAREEAATWMSETMIATICSDKKAAGSGHPSRHLFPNACAIVDAYSNAATTLPVSSILREMREDAKMLPACVAFQALKESEEPAVKIAAYDELDKLYTKAAAEKEVAESMPATDNAPAVAGMNDKLAKIRQIALERQRQLAAAPPAPTAAPAPIQQDLDYDAQTGAFTEAPVAEVTAAPIAASDAVVAPREADQVPKEALTEPAKTQSKNEAGEDTATRTPLTVAALADATFFASQNRYGASYAALSPSMGCASTGTQPAHCRFLDTLIPLAEAEDADDLAEKLEGLVDPLGGWRRKSKHKMWSITSLVGAQTGIEWLDGQDGDAHHSTSGMLGVVGVQRSWPVGKGNFGALLSVVDLGAMITYSEESSLDGGTTTSEANNSFSSVVSPGVYFTYSDSRSPFTFGIGGSKTPKLRSVKFDGGIEEEVDSLRALIFVAIDVTLFAW